MRWRRYFVTICTHERQRLFGEVASSEMSRSPLGDLAREEWLRTIGLYSRMQQDAFIVMPDHVHLLFGIVEPEPTGSIGPPRPGPRSESVGAIVGQYKAAVSRGARREDSHVRVWQRSYYDRVVRSEKEADAIRQYIAENPLRWFILDANRRDGHRL